MGPGGPGLSSTIPQGGDTATAALLGPHRDALYSKRENSKRLYQHLRGFIVPSAALATLSITREERTMKGARTVVDAVPEAVA